MTLHSDDSTLAVKPDRTHVDWTGDKPAENPLIPSGQRAPFSRPTMRGALEVLDVVCREWGVTVEALKSKDRHRNIASARQVASWLLRRTRGLSYPEIGIVLGKDHSTIMHAVAKVEHWLAIDGEFAESIERLRLELAPPPEKTPRVPWLETGRVG